MRTKRAPGYPRPGPTRSGVRQRFRDWHLPIPRPLWGRMQLLRFVDGRPLTEWARAILSEAADRVLLEGRLVLRLRPDSPIYRMSEPAEVRAPVAYAMGGETVLVLQRIEGLPGDLSTEPDYQGGGYWCDLIPEAGSGGMAFRRVIVLECDVLPRPATSCPPSRASPAPG